MSDIHIDTETETVTVTRTLRESGSSVVVTIPPECRSALSWDAGDSIEILADWGEGTLTLTKGDE